MASAQSTDVIVAQKYQIFACFYNVDLLISDYNDKIITLTQVADNRELE